MSLACAVVDEALACGEPEAAAVAERALGLAHRELLDVAAAERHLRASIAHADAGHLPVRAAEARLSLAVELVDGGRPAAALRELGRATAELGDEHPQLHIQLALVYARFGRYDDARTSLDRAIDIAQAAGELALVARARGNRGLAQAYRGDLDAAESDLREARSEHEQVGERLFALDCLHNLGWLLVRRGRLPEALALLDEAEAAIADLAVPLAPLRLDRAEALLAAGLPDEAEEAAASAARELSAAGRQGELPEALLLAARAALLAGRTTAAAGTAREAQALFDAQDRSCWAALCTGVVARADSLVADVTAAADTLAEHGLTDDAAELRLLAARRELESGDGRSARAVLADLAARRGTSAERVRAGSAGLLLAADDGDDARALRCAAASLAALVEQQQTWGALELQTAASLHTREIVAEAVAIAVRRPARELLVWADRARTAPVGGLAPPDDEQLRHDLEQLRMLGLQRRQLLLDEEAAPALLARQRQLEEAVRRRSRHVAAARPSAERRLTLGHVRERLQGRALVSVIEVRGELAAQVITSRSARVVPLGAPRVVAEAVRQLRLALQLVALGRPRAGALHEAAVRLAELLAPALRHRGGAVVVPTAVLAGVPWAALPSAADVEVTPSVELWCRAPRPAGDHDVVVVGPELAGAREEALAVAAVRPAATLLVGSEARAAAVLRALDGAELAHLACHGVFRDDNPLFSSFLLDDGPLTVHELARLELAPRHVVLSACDSGRGGQTPGRELLGAATALLSRGTQTVIASVVPVDDAATRALMTSLHRHWSSGARPAGALRAAQAEARDDVARASAQAFVCLTAGG